MEVHLTTGLHSAEPAIRSPLVNVLLASLRSPAAQRQARERLGISSPMLASASSGVPLARYTALFEDLAARHADPLLGAHLGTSQTAADALGLLGFLLLAMPTLSMGLEAITRHIGTWQTGTSVALQRTPDLAYWTYRIDDAAIWPRRQDAEYTLAIMCVALRGRLGSSWRPLEVHFEHPEPTCAPALRRLFGAPLRFNQPENRLILELSTLDTVLPTPFSVFVPYVEDYLCALAPTAGPQTDIVGQVREIVRRSLGHQEMSLDWVARTLQRSPRSLQRHLTAANTNLRKITQEVRRQEVEALLKTGGRRRADIAQALGYADHSALWRAVRSWSPSDITE